MRILVTGAAGFIGSHVVRKLLQQGHVVYGVVRKAADRERLTDVIYGIRLVELDLRDQVAVRSTVSEIRPDCAIHLAWYAVPGRFWTARENLDCVSMSLLLAQVLAESGCKRLLAAGTCAEYDWSYGFLSEHITPLEPSTLYGACKNATREILQAYCERASMSFAWTRFFYLYGPGEAKERLVPSVTLALLSGQMASCTSGEQIRDFLHVEDAASAVSAVAESDLAGAVNIGSGEPVKVRALVETIGRILGGSDRIVFGAGPTAAEEPPVLVADVRKLKLHTGWTPIWGLEDGLRQDGVWWQRYTSGVGIRP